MIAYGSLHRAHFIEDGGIVYLDDTAKSEYFLSPQDIANLIIGGEIALRDMAAKGNVQAAVAHLEVKASLRGKI